MVAYLLQENFTTVFMNCLIGLTKNRIKWLIEAVGWINVANRLGHDKLHSLYWIIS